MATPRTPRAVTQTNDAAITELDRRLADLASSKARATALGADASVINAFAALEAHTTAVKTDRTP